MWICNDKKVDKVDMWVCGWEHTRVRACSGGMCRHSAARRVKGSLAAPPVGRRSSPQSAGSPVTRHTVTEGHTHGPICRALAWAVLAGGTSRGFASRHDAMTMQEGLQQGSTKPRFAAPEKCAMSRSSICR